MKHLNKTRTSFLFLLFSVTACRTATPELVGVGTAQGISNMSLAKSVAYNRARSALGLAAGGTIEFTYTKLEGERTLKFKASGSLDTKKMRAQYVQPGPKTWIATLRLEISEEKYEALTAFRKRSASAKADMPKRNLAFMKALNLALRTLIEDAVSVGDGDRVEGKIALGTLERRDEDNTVWVHLEGDLLEHDARPLTEEERLVLKPAKTPS